MESQTHRQTESQTDRQMESQTQTDKLNHRQTDGITDTQTDRITDRQTNGITDTDGITDTQTDRQTDGCWRATDPVPCQHLGAVLVDDLDDPGGLDPGLSVHLHRDALVSQDGDLHLPALEHHKEPVTTGQNHTQPGRTT